MINKVYLYDGSFNDLLVLCAKLISLKIKPFKIVNESSYTTSLFDDVVIIERDFLIYEKFKKLVGFKVLGCVFKVYLSEEDRKELIIYYFLLNALKYKNEIFKMRNLRCVLEALRISGYVGRETHKFKGFTRFREITNNILYAEISPTNNILEPLSFHFQKRLNSEYWIIKDVKRKVYSVYDIKNFYLVLEENLKDIDLSFSDEEQGVVDLWLKFFKTVGIEERKNLRCQMNFMPKKYWNNIIEMSEYNEKSD